MILLKTLAPRVDPATSLGKKNAVFQRNLPLIFILLSVIIAASQNARIHSGIAEARKNKSVFLKASQKDFATKTSLKF